MLSQAIWQWMGEQKGQYLTSSAIGKTIAYAQDHQSRLLRFLDDPAIPLDNNAGERCQRQPVMGRNNFQLFRTINGADVATFYYTIVGSCKFLTLNPKAYLLEMGLRWARDESVLMPYEYSSEISQRVAHSHTLEEIFKAGIQ